MNAILPAQYDTDDARWVAIRTRDARADGRFVYAVATTGVYCHPSCAARPARPENISFHVDKKIRVWDIPSGKEIQSLSYDKGYITVAPDGFFAGPAAVPVTVPEMLPISSAAPVVKTMLMGSVLAMPPALVYGPVAVIAAVLLNTLVLFRVRLPPL